MRQLRQQLQQQQQKLQQQRKLPLSNFLVLLLQLLHAFIERSPVSLLLLQQQLLPQTPNLLSCFLFGVFRLLLQQRKP